MFRGRVNPTAQISLFTSTARRGFFMRYMAFLEEIRRITTDLDKRLSCSIDGQESYQELRDLISSQSEAN